MHLLALNFLLFSHPTSDIQVRGYFLYSLAIGYSFPTSGEAHYHEYVGFKDLRPEFVSGVGTRQFPDSALVNLWDLELGIVIADRFRIGASAGGGPIPHEGIGHLGIDVVRFNEQRIDKYMTLTLWADGGYARPSVLLSWSGFAGPLAGVRATLEWRVGYFILRPELYAHMHIVDRLDIDDTEGSYRDFTHPLPVVQIGAKLGLGVTFGS